MTATIASIPVDYDGRVGPSWGRAPRVAVATVDGGAVTEWTEHDVGWDALHDEGTEGGHHARIARFLMDNGVQVVVAPHVGPPMVRMLGNMGIALVLDAAGDARETIVEAVEVLDAARDEAGHAPDAESTATEPG